MLSCNMTDTGVHLIHLSNECIKASIHALKLHHDHLEGHTTRESRRKGGGRWSERGWRSCHLGPWPHWSKLGLIPSNGRAVDGTHDREMKRLGKRDRRMANDLLDSKKENKLIMGCRILIDIYKGEYK